MDTFIYSINTNSELFLLCHFYFSHDRLVGFWYTFITQKVNLTKWENFLTSFLYHKSRKAYAFAWHSSIFNSLPRAVFFKNHQWLSNRSFSRSELGRKMKMSCKDRGLFSHCTRLAWQMLIMLQTTIKSDPLKTVAWLTEGKQKNAEVRMYL